MFIQMGRFSKPVFCKRIDGLEKDLKSLIGKGILALLGILFIILFLSHFLKEPIHQFSVLFIELFGVYGVGFGILLSDSLPAFMIPDAFLILAVAGELPDFPVILLASFGSITGGSISYFLGRFVFPKIKFIQSFLYSHEEKLMIHFEKYGVWAVVLAATTPLPYSWMAILSGTLKMPFWKFLLSSLARAPRFLVYYYAIKLGWMS
jgi:membrane protein YqaA with SNARE-associated domain